MRCIKFSVILGYKKKGIYCRVGFANKWTTVKIKDNEKRDKYLDLIRELRKLWNMRMIPVVINVLWTVPKVFEKQLEELEIRGLTETIQTTPLIKLVRILRRVLETWGDLLSLEIHWKPSANTVLKNLQGIFTPLEFFPSVLADGFSLEFEWQQVSTSLQDSSQYSGCSQ